MASKSLPDLTGQVAFTDPQHAGAPVRLLVVADSFGPTQQISFLAPLEAWRDAGAAAIRLIDERSLQRLRSAGGGAAVNAFLTDQFRVFEPTALIFSRYAGPDYPVLFELARAAGAPVVHHLDDDLFEAPISLGIDIYQRLRQPHRVYATYRIAEAADLIYVSTPTLGERVRRRVNPKRLIVADLYVGADPDPALLPAAPPRRDADEVRIGYMASAGHAFDFELVAPALFALLNRFARLRLHLFGSIANTDAAREFGDRVVVHNRIVGTYGEFRKAMDGMEWDIGLAPLRTNPFNACKAPTKWVEYAEAGIPVLASDHPVYRPLARAGALSVCGDSDWEAALEALIGDPEGRAAMAVRARAKLRRDYRWRRLEDQVMDLIAALNPPSLAQV